MMTSPSGCCSSYTSGWNCEKSRSQALDRTQPSLPMKPGRADFLPDFPSRPLELGTPGLRRSARLFLGQGPAALEVVVAWADDPPDRAALCHAWRRRQQGRGVPLVLVALHGDRAAVCGPGGEEPPVYPDVDASIVEAVCATALRQTSRHAPQRFL